MTSPRFELLAPWASSRQVAAEDREHWDNRYAELGVAPKSEATEPLPLFAHVESLFPTSGSALDIACGRGRGSVWLASRGMTVHGVDISPVAIGLARQHAEQSGVAEACTLAVHDLDDGLPPGDPVDLVLCYLFREADIDRSMMERIKPGGLLAIACLSEVGHGPGRFRVKPGELTTAFASLEPLEAGEADGHAWFIGRC